METQLCKNCSNPYNSNFCSNCGQKTKTVQLDWHYVKDEIKYTFLHINKGFFYTIKQLYTRPGDTVREFIEGKRINHYKPILLVFVLAGISGFLTMQVNITAFMKGYSSQQQVSNPELNSKVMEEYSKAMHWMFAHYALFEILALPIVSFVSWLVFRKWGYNYIENIIINCFASGQRLVFTVFCTLLYLVIPESAFMKVGTLMSFMTFGLTIWTYATLYKDKESSSLVFRIFLFFLLLFVVGFILLVIFSIIFFVYLTKSGIITLPAK